MRYVVALFIFVSACGVPKQEPQPEQKMRLEFTCVAEPRNGKIIMSCADEKSWDEWKAQQQKEFGF